MGALQMFVTEDELSEIIKDFAQRRLLSGYVLNGPVYQRYNLLEQPIPYQGQPANYPFYLVPPMKPDLADALGKDLIQPRYNGWISVKAGKRVAHNDQDVLTMSIIAGEDNQRSAVKAGSWVRALKKTLAKRISFGVIGRNSVYSGQHFYPDIGYSNDALALYAKSVVWMQYVTDNGDFFPPEQAE